MEQLETRLALSQPTIENFGDTIQITGTDKNDYFRLVHRTTDGTYTDLWLFWDLEKSWGEVGDDHLWVVRSSFKRVRFILGGGDDYLEVGISSQGYKNGALEIEAFGGPGNDVIQTLGSSDTLIGGSGNDKLFAGSGNDWLAGDERENPTTLVALDQQGNDSLRGGGGRDTLVGWGGDDQIEGFGTLLFESYALENPDNATTGLSKYFALPADVESDATDEECMIFAGIGDDVAQGGDHNDTIYGDRGNDSIYGGKGEDWIVGDSRDPGQRRSNPFAEALDIIRGGPGSDIIFGEEGDDIIDGFGDPWFPGTDEGDAVDAHDIIYGGPGDDDLQGGPGNDTIHGGSNHDQLFGGSDNDQLRGDALDGLNLSVPASSEGRDTIHGGEGADKLWGDGNDDLLHGFGVLLFPVSIREELPTLDRDAVDSLFGGKGNDALIGSIESIGPDVLTGEAGLDRFLVASRWLGRGFGYDDRVLDAKMGKNGDDAVVGMVSDFSVPVRETSTSGGVLFTKGAWRLTEVEWVDRLFQEMVARTENTRLIKQPDGKPLWVARGANGLKMKSNGQGGFVLTSEPTDLVAVTGSYNGSPRFHVLGDAVFKNAFNNKRAGVRAKLAHEIAHLWAAPYVERDAKAATKTPTSKINELDWSGFKKVTGWLTDKEFKSLRPRPPKSYYVPARKDGNRNNPPQGWWHFNDGIFARKYGRTNPDEDFATSFESLFGGENREGNKRIISEKQKHVLRFFAILKS